MILGKNVPHQGELPQGKRVHPGVTSPLRPYGFLPTALSPRDQVPS